MQSDGSKEGPRPLGERISLHPKGDGAIVFVTDSGIYLQVNEIGRRVLEGFLDGRSEQECVDMIAAEYRSDRETVAKDVHRFIAHMRIHTDI